MPLLTDTIPDRVFGQFGSFITGYAYPTSPDSLSQPGGVAVDGAENPDAAWYYPDPKPAARNIKDHVAFWNGVTVER